MRIYQLTIISALVFLAGCADQYGRQTTSPPSGQVISSPSYGGPSTASTDYDRDRALENQLRQALSNGNLSRVASGVSVSAKNGAVTLTGSVPSESDRQAIEALVRNTSGVLGVTDQLQVSTTRSTPPSYTSGASSGQNTMETDQSLAELVKQTLRSNATSGSLAQNISVSAQNGAITLTGTIPSEQQRQTVDNIVRNIRGVNSVYDQMQLAAAPTGRTDQPAYSYGNQSYDTQPQPQPQPAPSYPASPSSVPASSATSATGDIFNLHVQGLNDRDRNLAQGILQSLRTDALLQSMLPTVNINISGGRVILNGTVQSEQQRQAIGSVVQRAAGASNVENQLQITTQ